jgi:hypothetical protein
MEESGLVYHGLIVRGKLQEGGGSRINVSFLDLNCLGSYDSFCGVRA